VAGPVWALSPDRFKTEPSSADVNPVSVHPDNLTWTQSEDPIRVVLDAENDYSMFDDDQLIAERDRQQNQLDELTMHPGSSPAVGQLRSSIESEVGRMTDELLRRARSRHPSSHRMGGRLRSLRFPTGLPPVR
jgi:hypothetical protein